MGVTFTFRLTPFTLQFYFPAETSGWCAGFDVEWAWTGAPGGGGEGTVAVVHVGKGVVGVVVGRDHDLMGVAK